MDEQFKDEIERARKLYSVCGLLGVSNRKRWIVCPLPGHDHANYTPSFSVYNTGGLERFKCHGNCGAQGDVVDLAGYLYVPGYNPSDGRHVRRALAALGMKVEYCPPKPEPPPPAIAQNQWTKYVPPGPVVRMYARRRGLSKATLQKFKIGQYMHFMTMPSFEEGTLKGIKCRNTWPIELCDNSDVNHLRFWSCKGSKGSLFNYDGVAYTSDPVLILKAEIPVMLCDQVGFLACAPTGGEGSLEHEHWERILSFSRRRVVIGDNDHMKESAERRAKALNAELRYPPEDYKDIDEWMLADEHSIGVIKQWLM